MPRYLGSVRALLAFVGIVFALVATDRRPETEVRTPGDVQAISAEYCIVDEVTGAPIRSLPSELEALAAIVGDRLDERAEVTVRTREDGSAVLAVEAGVECGYTPARLETVVTSSGGVTFRFVATDSDLVTL